MAVTGRLRRALGVTRVARVTGLDRAGVEVACAVRPGGHVLQVTNGKGSRWAEAEAGALLEAAELAGAERVAAADLRWASVDDLRRRGVPHLSVRALGGDAEDGAPLAWRVARDARTGTPRLVPAAALHVPPPGGPLLGLTGLRWTSNGMGAHPSRSHAVLHALLEAVERDAVARALPDGWTAAAMGRRRVAPEEGGGATPARLVARLRAVALDAHLFDLTDPRRPALAVRGALLVDAHGPVSLTAGYACRLDGAAASMAALLEAAQSRLTDIHGAREDVVHAASDAASIVTRTCRPPPRRRPGRRARPRRGGGAGARPPAGAAAGVRAVLDALERTGHEAVVADLGWPALGIAVVKVLVPGLARSELL